MKCLLLSLAVHSIASGKLHRFFHTLSKERRREVLYAFAGHSMFGALCVCRCAGEELWIEIPKINGEGRRSFRLSVCNQSCSREYG